MKPKSIYLFTSSFPYGLDESFLEEEIKHLSDHFEEVRIFPNKIQKSIRKMPSNVVVDNSWSNILKKRSIQCLSYKVILNFISQFKFDFTYLILLLKYLCSEQKIDELFKESQYLNKQNSIFYTYWFGATTTGLSLWKQNNENINIITRVHGIDLYEERLNIEEFPLRKSISKNINTIFTISKHGYDHISGKIEQKDNIMLSSLGTQQPICKNPYNNNGILKIISCSNVLPVKRLELLINALSTIPNNVKVEWTHAGNGVSFEKIKNLANKKLMGKIDYTFLDHITNQEIHKLYSTHSYDVFINVSKSEGLPVSIMEAQSYSIPVLATDVGGVSEIVNNINGLLVQENISPETLGTLITEVHNNKNLWFSKRNLSKLNWDKHFDAKKNYWLFTEELKQIIERNN